MRKKGTPVPPDHRPAPLKIIGELLTSNPEAASLLGEACYRQTQAAYSTADTTRKSRAAQAARLAYEEVRRRLESRRSHPIHFAVGLLLLLVLAAGLVMLVITELGGLLGDLRSVLLALGATAAWLTAAWLALVTIRRRRRVLVAATIAAAGAFGLLLVAWHAFAPALGWPGVGGRAWASLVFGALTGAFIPVLTTGAAVLMAHMEPASLLLARWRWHRARTVHEAAAETQQADAGAAAVATEAWLGLVRAQATAIAADEEHLVQATAAVAAVLLESPPQFAPSE
jgi:hypothetical protein